MYAVKKRLGHQNLFTRKNQAQLLLRLAARVSSPRWSGPKDALWPVAPAESERKSLRMKPTFFVSTFAVSALVIAGLGLTGCQQSPPPAVVATPPQQSSTPPPTTSTDSTTTTKSTEVKPADATDPNAPPAVNTTTTESTTVKKKQ